MILITRPITDSKKTQQALLEHEIPYFLEPLIEFVPYSELSIGYVDEILLVTSKNAIRSLMLLTTNRDYKIIAIGEETAHYAYQQGFCDVIAAGDNVQDLVRYVLQYHSRDKMVYLSGKNVSHPLVDILGRAQVISRRVIVYNMLYQDTFSAKCYNYLLNNKIDGVAFFSLNTARVFITLIKKYNMVHVLKNIYAYSLSAKIGSFLTQCNWRKIYSAESPTHDSFIGMIINN